MSSWRNRLARSTVNRKVGGSSPPEDDFFYFFFSDQWYKNFIVDEDEKMFITIRQCVLSLRNATCSMHTDIKRDYNKLFPSGDQQDASFSMY